MNRGPGRRALCAAAALAALPAGAAEWALDAGWQWQAASEERAPGNGAATRVDEMRLRGSATLARSLEHLGTRADATLDLPVAASGERLTQGSLALSHRLSLPTESFTASAEYAVDDNRDERRSAADEVLGRVRRERLAWSGAWQHAFDERWSAQASVSGTQVGFQGDAGGGDWREGRWAMSASWRADEITTLTGSVARSTYRLTSGDARSDTDSLNLSLARSLDERTSLSLGLGRYRTDSERVLRGFACPLPLPLCQSGVVAPVPVALAFDSTSSGTQYSLGWQHAAAERTSLSLSASRQLSPSALGVSRSDTLALSASQAWTPGLEQNFSAARSASRVPLAEGSALDVRLETLESALRWRLDPDWSLAASARWQRLDGAGTGSGGHTLRLSISLQYQLPRIVATR